MGKKEDTKPAATTKPAPAPAKKEEKPAAPAPTPEPTPEPEAEPDADDDGAEPLNLVCDDKGIPLIRIPGEERVQRGVRRAHFFDGVAKENKDEARARFIDYQIALWTQRKGDHDAKNDPVKKMDLEIRKLEEKLAALRAKKQG